ncbi:hypothetical protein [Paenibacillus lutrae]|uniref:Uncharacterized protein n=1 Tax=Paenibacillus lutrae TaxID=2078573 RepID=A0A7X3K1D5_9BACL|nr:hypothetical protein [Paenibacillus lutrae]MVP02138.1 hypothetical protein [Paenibacillus lutrae]
MGKRKEIVAGQMLGIRTSNQEDSIVIDWYNNQGNLSDAIRYLVEQEIRQHGLRNLQNFIPSKRPPIVPGNPSEAVSFVQAIIQPTSSVQKIEEPEKIESALKVSPLQIAPQPTKSEEKIEDSLQPFAGIDGDTEGW